MDSNGKGILTKQDLRNALHKFILPISKQEFNKLWSRYKGLFTLSVLYCVFLMIFFFNSLRFLLHFSYLDPVYPKKRNEKYNEKQAEKLYV